MQAYESSQRYEVGNDICSYTKQTAGFKMTALDVIRPVPGSAEHVISVPEGLCGRMAEASRLHPCKLWGGADTGEVKEECLGFLLTPSLLFLLPSSSYFWGNPCSWVRKMVADPAAREKR